MRLVDTNILLYAVDNFSPHHTQASLWLENSLNTWDGMGLAWLALAGFIRLSTRTGLLKTPMSIEVALSCVDDWVRHPNTRILQPGDRHADILARLLLQVGTAGNLTNDAHLAALAIEHNVEMVSFDRDFKRFSGLKFHHLS